jgi:nitroreductase
MKRLTTTFVFVSGLSVLAVSSPVQPQSQDPAQGKNGIAASDRAAVDHILTTTRSVRKRLDLTRPVEPEIIEEAIAIALQAPTGSNIQNWHFIVISDSEKKKAIADLYRKGADLYRSRPRPGYGADDPRTKQRERISESGTHLYKHLHEVPVLVIACIEGRVETQPQFVQASTYGSILPAAWSFMLALRARGVGSAWTTLHLIHEKDAAQVLGIPDHVTQAVLMPVAYYTGTDFQPAKRLPAQERTHWNSWGQRRTAVSPQSATTVSSE